MKSSTQARGQKTEGENICVKRKESGPGSVYVACSSVPWRWEGYSWGPSRRPLQIIVSKINSANRWCVRPMTSGLPLQTTSGTPAAMLSPSALVVRHSRLSQTFTSRWGRRRAMISVSGSPLMAIPTTTGPDRAHAQSTILLTCTRIQRGPCSWDRPSPPILMATRAVTSTLPMGGVRRMAGSLPSGSTMSVA